MTGRTCDTPKQQYYTPSLDFLLYEAEGSRTDGQIIIREPYRDGREDTWTGPGFVKTFEGGYIVVTVEEIKRSMDYDIIIKYEPTTPDSWDEVTLTIERQDEVDPNGPCAHVKPAEDYRRLALPSNSRSITAYPPVCLEEGKPYKIRLEFPSDRNKDKPPPSILIDSIALVPRIDNIPWFHGSPAADIRRQEYERFHCSNPSYFGKGSQAPEICKKYHASIGAYVFNGAFCEYSINPNPQISCSLLLEHGLLTEASYFLVFPLLIISIFSPTV